MNRPGPTDSTTSRADATGVARPATRPSPPDRRARPRRNMLGSVAGFVPGFLIASLLMAVGFWAIWIGFRDATVERLLQRMDISLRAVINAYQGVSEVLIDEVIRQPSVTDLFYRGVQAEPGEARDYLRGLLYRRLYDTYERSSKRFLRQLHFYDLAGKSFLRMHAPTLSGDNLLEARPAVRRMLETGEPIFGFENGKVFHGYRYIHPLRFGDELIGGVETSVSLDEFERELAVLIEDFHFRVLLNKATLWPRLFQGSQAFYFQSPVDPNLVDEDIPAWREGRTPVLSELEQRYGPRVRAALARSAEYRRGQPFGVPIYDQGKDYVALFQPMSESTGEVGGWIMAIGPAPTLADYRLTLTLGWLIATLLTAGLMLTGQRLLASQDQLRLERNRLATITEALPEGLFVQDQDGRLTFYNPALKHLLGYDDEALRHGHAHDLFHFHGVSGEQVPRDECPIRMRTAAGEVYRSEEELFRRADGTLMPVAVVSAPMRDGTGHIRGSLTVFNDVSERRAMLHAIEDARAQAEANARVKSQFLANMSHEIRTPLNGVLGMLSLALETELSARQRELLSVAYSSGDTLLAILNDILDMSKIEAGKLEIETIEFDLFDVLAHIGKLFAPQAAQKGLEFVAVVQPDLPQRIFGDPTRLRQVLSNLISNAIKFTPSGEVRLEVGRSSLAGEQTGGQSGAMECLQVIVRDTGVGMSRETLARLFQPFNQADASTSRRYGGTGLGLALSQQLMRLMGGQISANSTVTQGSAFIIELPLRAGSAPDAARGELEAWRGQRCLLVDDHGINLQVLQRYMEQLGLQVETESNPESVLARILASRAAGTPFALLLTDFLMPGLDGLAVARQVRGSLPAGELRIILATSAANELDETALREAGLNAWITKPVFPHELQEALIRARGDGSAPIAPVAVGWPQYPGARVLLVEDNLINQKVAAGALRRFGIQPELAENGEEALTALTRESFDLVLMDCHMPVMDGLEATRCLRRKSAQNRHGRPLPIIALSAVGTQAEIQHCLGVGMDDFLGKPFKPEQLAQVLRTWLDLGQTPAQSAGRAAEPTTLVPGSQT